MSSRHCIKFLVEKFESLNVSMRTLILQEIEISSNIYFQLFFYKEYEVSKLFSKASWTTILVS